MQILNIRRKWKKTRKQQKKENKDSSLKSAPPKMAITTSQ
jgi:ribosomal protein S12